MEWQHRQILSQPGRPASFQQRRLENPIAKTKVALIKPLFSFMRNKILAANWKMNLTQTEVSQWLQDTAKYNWQAPGKELRVYPSAIYLQQMMSFVHVGAQNFYFQDNGAFTGEISLSQLKSIGVSSVLVGHSERRELFAENNLMIAQKVRACVQHDLPFILCCGETLNIRNENLHLTFIQTQLQAALEAFSSDHLHLLSIAYEPIWAIGSGLAASQEQITEMHTEIRKILEERFGVGGQDIPILYGGSVSPANAKEIFSCPHVGGALVGGASLDPQVFNQLWEQL
ncbi:MAG: triose-phosphate isomerase [Flavobacteriales bacterium]